MPIMVDLLCYVNYFLSDCHNQYNEDMNTYQKETTVQSMESTQDSFHSQIQLKEDGCYEWTCKLNKSRNQHLLSTIMAMILIPSAVIFTAILLYSAHRNIQPLELLYDLRLIVAMLMLVTVIIVFCYLLIEKADGGPSVFTYEMNDYGIRLKPGRVTHQNDMRESADTSVFRAVRTIRIDREQYFIALNSWFLYNLIYCNPEDFDFVVNYITERCVRAIILKH